jgi:nitrogen fixation protein FixH
MSAARKPREITGKHVLFCMLGFFAVVFAVNGAMVKAATSTFGGVQTTSSYKVGLKFNHEIDAAGRQDAMHWQVAGKLTRAKTGAAVLDIAARDDKGVPLAGLTATATLAHPADARRDHDVPLTRSGVGAFHGEAQAERGQWELIVDLYREDARVFRSRSRVTLD